MLSIGQPNIGCQWVLVQPMYCPNAQYWATQRAIPHTDDCIHTTGGLPQEPDLVLSILDNSVSISHSLPLHLSKQVSYTATVAGLPQLGYLSWATLIAGLPHPQVAQPHHSHLPTVSDFNGLNHGTASSAAAPNSSADGNCSSGRQ
jgi:hypothetical protein